MLASCDQGTALGLRDLAVLTLLSRLGLRIGEVAGLKLQPIVATLILMVAGRGLAQLFTDGQIVTVYLAKAAPAPKPKGKKEKDKDELADDKPLIKMIVIQREPPAAPGG